MHGQYCPNFLDFKIAFIHSLNKYLLKVYYMTDPEETAVNKIDKSFTLIGFTF